MRSRSEGTQPAQAPRRLKGRAPATAGQTFGPPPLRILILDDTDVDAELAVAALEAVKAGATDYVLKSRLARLGVVVQRALSEKQEQRERRKAEDALRRSEERFRVVADVTFDAIWDWNLITDEFERNETMQDFFGYRVEQIRSTAQWWMDHIHPEDVEGWIAVESEVGRGTTFRVWLPDLQVVWSTSKIRPMPRGHSALCACAVGASPPARRTGDAGAPPVEGRTTSSIRAPSDRPNRTSPR